MNSIDVFPPNRRFQISLETQSASKWKETQNLFTVFHWKWRQYTEHDCDEDSIERLQHPMFRLEEESVEYSNEIRGR